MSDPELRVKTCNVVAGRSAYSDGAKAYLLAMTGSDRCYMLVRSRSGRWIRTWVAKDNLANWRETTVVPESSAYKHLR